VNTRDSGFSQVRPAKTLDYATAQTRREDERRDPVRAAGPFLSRFVIYLCIAIAVSALFVLYAVVRVAIRAMLS
jgi:hypothetical protein